MACSNCNRDGHNVQTCRFERRARHCGQCGAREHDRRNCPRLGEDATETIGAHCSPQVRERLCYGRAPLLAHLYWPKRQEYFEQNLRRYKNGEDWLLVATPEHGAHSPPRPTINFLAADRTFAEHYEEASANRGFKHGILVLRSEVEKLEHSTGYELAEVKPCHPHAADVHDEADFWRFDIPQHRYKALDALRFTKVVRLATPFAERRRMIWVPHKAIVAWW